MPAAFPTTAQVATFLTEAGLLTGSLPSSLAGVATAAKVEWEVDSGYCPWIAASETTRYYELEGGTLLSLEGGVVSVASVIYNGRELTEGSEYILEPPNAPADERPYTHIRFLMNVYSRPSNIIVRGTFGYRAPGSDAVPQDVFDAVLRRAAVKAVGLLRGTFGPVAGPLTSVKQDDVQYTWAQGAETDLAVGGPAQWEREYQDTLRRYRRRWFV